MENKELTLEELKKVLALKGIDIKELAAEAKALEFSDEATEIVVKEKKSRKKQEGPSFELSLKKYPDFAITKHMSNQTKIMVFMVSLKKYYIKTIKTNGEEIIEQLDATNYSTFTRGLNSENSNNSELCFGNDFWVERLESGQEFYCALMLYINSYYDNIIFNYKYCQTPQSLLNAYRESNSSDVYERKNYDWHYIGDMSDKKKYFNRLPNLFKKLSSFDERTRRLIENYPKIAIWLYEKFGYNNMVDFFESSRNTLIRLDSLSGYLYMDEYFKNVELKYDSFKNYLFYESVRMGMGRHLNDFIITWNDTLNMQIKYYGKIKDKYPKMLLLEHQILSYKMELLRENIDIEMFNKQRDSLLCYEASIDEYSFIVPKSREDFYDEASQQANCLAGYVSLFAEGKSNIFFMRLTDDIETSLVTIEVTDDFCIKQAYRALNNPISSREKEVIDKWIVLCKKSVA